MAQIALAWLLAKPYVTSVIIGATKMSQLEDNLKVAELQLRDAEIAELDALTAPPALYPRWFAERTVDEPQKKALAAAG